MGKNKKTIHVDALSSMSTPPDTLEPTQVIARNLGGRGNNLFAVQLPTGKDGDLNEALVELESKFRKTVYLRRGGYVLVDREALNTERDNKLGGMIVGVVVDEKEWRKMSYWPQQFKARKDYEDDEDEDEDDEESNMGKMPPSGSEEEEVEDD